MVKSEKKDKSIERDSSEIKVNNRNRAFDRKRKIICYSSGEKGHIKPNCSVIKENEHPIKNIKVEEITVKVLNHI